MPLKLLGWNDVRSALECTTTRASIYQHGGLWVGVAVGFGVGFGVGLVGVRGVGWKGIVPDGAVMCLLAGARPDLDAVLALLLANVADNAADLVRVLAQLLADRRQQLSEERGKRQGKEENEGKEGR